MLSTPETRERALITIHFASRIRWYVLGLLECRTRLLRALTLPLFSKKASVFVQSIFAASKKGSPTAHNVPDIRLGTKRVQYLPDFEGERWMLLPARHLNYDCGRAPLQGTNRVVHAISNCGTNFILFLEDEFRRNWTDQHLMTDATFLEVVSKAARGATPKKCSKKRKSCGLSDDEESVKENSEPNIAHIRKRLKLDESDGTA